MQPGLPRTRRQRWSSSRAWHSPQSVRALHLSKQLDICACSFSRDWPVYFNGATCLREGVIRHEARRLVVASRRLGLDLDQVLPDTLLF